MMKVRTRGLLEDLRDTALVIEHYLDDVSQETYIGDVKLRDAVERRLIILGEIMIRIRSTDPETEVRISNAAEIIGLRHRLAHGYDVEISDVTIFNVGTLSIPLLLEDVNRLLSA